MHPSPAIACRCRDLGKLHRADKRCQGKKFVDISKAKLKVILETEADIDKMKKLAFKRS
ncbi:hypothetical protein F441_22502 [Phytophthora nicotianae CJ01A1]|uniref:Uncharacterized protein n=4 Tax=Phytophthora nicotianae TaxID=4792 RepID=V9F2A9_PHYNI|nr:hypothetical protein F443_10835 [Phytophthora nicotianae P1569]ETK88986.1 hypothetical protein L915_06850 [Phytophthora nicotianae]ETP00078.1 hypothetical protein F441_22502 [Phytophthora nicotianae CJ01A1]ETP27661.1 hypothetical protein F442_23063 [Phytophthora nicotianae P10297]ETL42392.1 hypothetical protein L916_06793 [Phytophthora nicotianae]